ncbi:MAG: hypothetical protein QOK21_3993 [Solirubrobacteraceae bacterium]|nr:hypothetical protein [Solirubrobacteraceae bacterium]
MSRAIHSGWFWTGVWAMMLFAHTAYMGAFAGEIDLVDVLLLGGAGIAVFMVALLAMRRGDAEPPTEAVDAGSLPTVLAAVGFAALLVGVEVGPWLLAMGAGVLVAGLAGLARELRGRA